MPAGRRSRTPPQWKRPAAPGSGGSAAGRLGRGLLRRTPRRLGAGRLPSRSFGAAGLGGLHAPLQRRHQNPVTGAPLAPRSLPGTRSSTRHWTAREPSPTRSASPTLPQPSLASAPRSSPCRQPRSLHCSSPTSSTAGRLLASTACGRERAGARGVPVSGPEYLQNGLGDARRVRREDDDCGPEPADHRQEDDGERDRQRHQHGIRRVPVPTGRRMTRPLAATVE